MAWTGPKNSPTKRTTTLTEYRPLPAGLTIAPSGIDGLGVFATQPIPQGVDLGETHIQYPYGDLIRTPLGGFINHSDTPNCWKQEHYHQNHRTWRLVTYRGIMPNEEITLAYTLVEAP